MSISTAYDLYKNWDSKPVPPPELLPQVRRPDWGRRSDESLQEWEKDIKVTWLGHACFMAEFPPPAEGIRGARVLFDPVWSHRCSPVQFMGPARVTKPPFELKDMPEIDLVVQSHDHYDHTDVATLKHIYNSQPKGSVHFFSPLGNKSWFKSTIGVKDEYVTELDWWQVRECTVKLGQEGVESTFRITCTPCQHFSGRGLLDRNKTLWASWAVQQYNGRSKDITASVWHAGDCGLRSVEKGMTAEDEDKLTRCPAYQEIGDKLGPFDVSCIPIGAYSPRFFMSRVHCSPEDAVEVHQMTRSRKSLAMHHSTWMLTDEEMTEPPKRLKQALKDKGLRADEFVSLDIGETARVTPQE
ncbi:Protein-lysine N-methyltransferase efm4 [Microbotryomycetes sp. JL201]|nr:Protein-lysine N-methyltransferase efm4 [Microbotryomycetes sp. JL201]